MVNDTQVGQEIRDKVFSGNPYAQLSLIRKSMWALNVLLNENSTTEEKAFAQGIILNAEAKDKQIEVILRKHYPEEYSEDE